MPMVVPLGFHSEEDQAVAAQSMAAAYSLRSLTSSQCSAPFSKSCLLKAISMPLLLKILFPIHKRRDSKIRQQNQLVTSNPLRRSERPVRV